MNCLYVAVRKFDAPLEAELRLPAGVTVLTALAEAQKSRVEREADKEETER